MRQPAFAHGRRALARRNKKSDAAKVKKLTKACNKRYPPVKVGLSVLSFGVHGVTRKKRRNDCLSAARQGNPDPRAKKTGQTELLGKYYKLWAVEEPWTERPTDEVGNVLRVIGVKTGGDALRNVARGRRPPKKQHYQDLERKATILGGVMTLQAIGIDPWLSFDLAGVPALKLRNDSSYRSLMNIVKAGSELEGAKAPANLIDASEYVRKRVMDEDAGGPAWAARAMHLTLAGMGANDKRSKVESGVAVGTSLAAKGLYTAAAGATGTIIGAPVGAVLGAVGGIMDGISIGMSALSGRSKTEQSVAKGEASGWAQKFQQLLEKRAIREQKELVEAQIKVAEAQQQLEDEASRIQAEKITKVITAAVWVGVLGGTAFLGYTAVQAIKRRRAA